MKNLNLEKFPPNKPAPIPKELGRPGRALWKALTQEYNITDSAGLCILLSVCRSEDTIQKLLAIIEVDGPVVVDRFNQKQPHPLLAAIRGAEQTKRQALTSLRLDIEPLAARPGKQPLGGR